MCVCVCVCVCVALISLRNNRDWTYTTVMRDAVSPYMDFSRPVMRPLFCGKLRMFPAIATVSNHDDPLLQMKQYADMAATVQFCKQYINRS